MNEKDIARYYSILDKHQRGSTRVSKEDIEFFLRFTPKIDETAMQSIIDQSNNILKGTTDPNVRAKVQADIESAMQNMSLYVATQPEYKDKIVDLYETKLQGKEAASVRNALNTALGAIDMGISAGQISRADREARRSQRPSRPTPLTADPLLQQAIADAQQGNFETAKRLAPAKQAILDSYLADMANAQVASTGQAGAYGALGQRAALRRSRNEMELAPLAADIDFRNKERLDNLTRMKLAENQAIQASQAQYYPADLEQYRMEQQQAGLLGAQGRSNMRAGLANVAQAVPDAVAQRAAKRRMDIYNQMASAGFDPDEIDTGMKADERLINGFPPPSADPYRWGTPIIQEQMWGYQPNTRIV
jgi:hypothetical protein